MVKQLSVTFLFVAACMLSGAEKNLIRNGSFEQWNNAKNLPVAWSGSVIKDKNIFKQTADTAADGKHSIVWTDSRQSSLNQWVAVKGGKYYRFSCKAKYNINPWNVMFRVSWRGKGKVLPGAQMRLRNGIQNDWTEIVIDNLRAPEGATTAVIEIGPYASHQKKKIISKSIYVDDVKFVEFTPDKSELRNLASIPLSNKKLNCVVDGKADETFWSTAATADNFLSTGNLMVAKLKSTVKLAADKENIYVFAKLYSPKIDTKKQSMEERDKVAYNGDFFEFGLQIRCINTFLRNFPALPGIHKQTADENTRSQHCVYKSMQEIFLHPESPVGSQQQNSGDNQQKERNKQEFISAVFGNYIHQQDG